MEPVAGQGAERGSSRRGLPGTARTWSRTSEPQRNPFVAWEASGRAASLVWQPVPASDQCRPATSATGVPQADARIERHVGFSG